MPPGARYRRALCCLLWDGKHRHPRTCLTPLHTSPAHSPVNASRLPSRATRASLGAGAVRYTFTVADFHCLPPAGLPAHPSTHDPYLPSTSPAMLRGGLAREGVVGRSPDALEASGGAHAQPTVLEHDPGAWQTLVNPNSSPAHPSGGLLLALCCCRRPRRSWPRLVATSPARAAADASSSIATDGKLPSRWTLLTVACRSARKSNVGAS